MSGSDDAGRSPEPLEFTEDDIKELAGRRAKPVAAVARMRKLVPTEAIGKLASDLPGPARMTRKELTSMRRAGKRSEKIMTRLTSSDVPAEELGERKDQRRSKPTKKPPVKA